MLWIFCESWFLIWSHERQHTRLQIGPRDLTKKKKNKKGGWHCFYENSKQRQRAISEQWACIQILNQSEQPCCCLIRQYFQKIEMRACKVQYVYSNPIFWHIENMNFKINSGDISCICKIIGIKKLRTHIADNFLKFYTISDMLS